MTSFNPRIGAVAGTIPESSPAEIADTLRRSADAATRVAAVGPATRRDWLYAIAQGIESHRDELVDLADLETALGRERLTGELARAAGQLRFYGDVACEGSYLDVAIDEATSSTSRLVRFNRPLGPVAVFGAGNFPFAFGALGNDTGSALAAGCPVIVKAHPAHVLLSSRLAEVTRSALHTAGAPEGTFAMVVGYDAGVTLVSAPEVAAVAFTGSQQGGLALWRLANDREIVIPVYAEMGTVNPVVVTRAAVAAIDELAEGFVGSFSLGSGQYCTKPGLMLAPSGHGVAATVGRALAKAAPEPIMLTQATAAAVSSGLDALTAAGAHVVYLQSATTCGWAAPAAVLEAPISQLRPESRLLEECFGAVALVAEYTTDEELRLALTGLQGSLAASLFATDSDPDAARCMEMLSAKAGRVVMNEWPTGVAYTWAQHHGGPWPATSDARATSVGAAGLARFVRPVTFQSTPDYLLPEAVHAGNPWQIPRRINGVLQTVTA